MSTVAIIVTTYNPESYRFKFVFTLISGQVDRMVITNNGSSSRDFIKGSYIDAYYYDFIE